MLRAHKDVSKTIKTLNGPLTFLRKTMRPADEESAKKLYALEGRRTIAPLDMALGIENLPFKMTVGLMLEIARYAVLMDSYDLAEEEFSNNFHFSINNDTIRLVTNCIGNLVFEEDCRRADKSKALLDSGKLEFLHDREGNLYLETDGASLNTWGDSGKGAAWRENKLGMAFTDSDLEEWRDKDGELRRRILTGHYTNILGTAEEFKWHFFNLALRKGYGRYKKTILISDGATWIRNLKEELFPDAQQILDLYHLCENAGKFALLLEKDEKKAHECAERWCDMLRQGKWRDLLVEIEPHKNFKVPEGCVNLYRYVENNRNNIDYPTYREQGLFVGSGAVESANKRLMQSRMKLSGMIWKKDSAQSMLSLKAKFHSDLWGDDVRTLAFREMNKVRPPSEDS